MPTPRPECWVCLGTCSEAARFSVPFPFGLPEEFQRPLTDFGLCSRHTGRARQGLLVALPERDRGSDTYLAVSCRDHARRVRVRYPRVGKVGRSAAYIEIRRRRFSVDAACLCGRSATELGHLIPRYWLALNNYPQSVGDFPENLLPFCADCNQCWHHYSPFAWDAADYWRAHSRTYRAFSRRQRGALRILTSHGIRVFRPPRVSLRHVPAQPLLARPKRSSRLTFDVLGYVCLHWRMRTHSNLRVRGPLFRASPLWPFLLVDDGSTRPNSMELAGAFVLKVGFHLFGKSTSSDVQGPRGCRAVTPAAHARSR